MAFESDDCYEYMRLTHTLAVCWGLPIIRKQISVTGEPGKKSTVKGKRELLSLITIKIVYWNCL